MKAAAKKRFAAEPPRFEPYLLLRHEGILARCPDCGGDALLRRTREGVLRLACRRCHGARQWDGRRPAAAAQGRCVVCGRWFNLPLPGTQGNDPRVRVDCPHCGRAQTAPVVRTGRTRFPPMDGLELYYQAQFRGNRIWAYNRAHLDYLIDYVEASLREKHRCTDRLGELRELASGQAQRLPRFVKLAKNRVGLLRVLRRMRAL